jgi:hypothetical protein
MQIRTTLPLCAGLLSAVMFAACTPSREVIVANEIDPAGKGSVVVLGREHAAVSGPELRFKVPVRASVRDDTGVRTTACLVPECLRDSPRSNSLTVRLQTFCGAAEFCVEYSEAGGKPLRGRLLYRKRDDFVPCLPEVRRIWMDNRDGPARTITVGRGFKTKVAAGQWVRFDVAAPLCDAMAEVRLDGELIGSLPLTHDGLTFAQYKPADFLIDPSGARCYVRSSVNYAPYSGASGGPPSESFSASRFHSLGLVVDHFLEQPPDSVMAPGGIETRIAVLETKCE